MVIPTSDVALQQARKKALTDGKNLNTLGDMMLKHFREVMNDTGFYSLPAFLLKRVRVQTLGQALTTSPAMADASGLLPIADAESARPLADRQMEVPALMVCLLSLFHMWRFVLACNLGKGFR